MTIAAGPASPVGVYPVTITGTAASSSLTTLSHAVSVQLTVDATALPSPWAFYGVGSGASTAAATHLNETFTLNGAGTGIGGTADSMTLACQPIGANTSFVARVARTDAAASAGLVVRDGQDPAAASVFAGIGSGTLAIQHRDTAGADTTAVAGATVQAPYWLQIARAGDTYTSYTSVDGARWSQLGQPVTVPMPQACVGFAAAGGSADFDRAMLAQAADFYLSDAQPAVRTIGTSAPAATFAVSVEPLNGYSQPVELSVSGLPAGATAYFSPQTIAVGTGSILHVDASGVAAGAYPITLAATDGIAVHQRTATLVVVSGMPAGLPDPWIGGGVGVAPAGAGSTYSSGTLTVSGGGTGDSAQFVYQPLIGDVTLVARLAGLVNPQPQAIA